MTGLRSLGSRWRCGLRPKNFAGSSLTSSVGAKYGVAGPDCSRERLCGASLFKSEVGQCFRAVKATLFERNTLVSATEFRGCNNARSFSRVCWQDPNEAPRLLVVQPRIHPVAVLKAKLLEALRLADSLEDTRQQEPQPHLTKNRKQNLAPYVLVQSPSLSGRSSSKRLQARAYFGAGTIDIVRAHLEEIASQGRIDAVFVNVPLTGVQQRNLEDAWGKPVFDRVGLIIEIFGAHAKTKAARLQVELASLYHKRSRLVRVRGSAGARLGFGDRGESQVVSARGRATGAIGGAGETEIQLQRRRIGERQYRLKLLIAEIDRTQTLHRAARQRQGLNAAGNGSRLPVVAVVGYTNAGKSSLVAAMSQSSLYIDDKLFATLDTCSRKVVLPSGQKVILSDTVGFISDLPTQLVRAFQSTLDEVVEADYLLHVIDSSAPNAREQREAVLRVLEDIGTPKHQLQNCLIEVWNKADLAEGFQEIGKAVPVVCDKPILSKDYHEQTVDIGERITVKRAEILGLEWRTEGVSCVATSVRTRMGLKELCHVLDKNLCCEIGRQRDVESEESF